MLNFLGAISSLLPGYIQGRKQAIQDNWQDLQNYNNVQAGQLSNAFTSDTWQQRIDMMNDAAINSGLNTWLNGMNTAIHAAYFPGQLTQGQVWSQWAPALTQQGQMLQYMANQLGMRNPMMLFRSRQQPQSATNPAPSEIGG